MTRHFGVRRGLTVIEKKKVTINKLKNTNIIYIRSFFTESHEKNRPAHCFYLETHINTLKINRK